MAKTEM